MMYTVIVQTPDFTHTVKTCRDREHAAVQAALAWAKLHATHRGPVTAIIDTTRYELVVEDHALWGLSVVTT